MNAEDTTLSENLKGDSEVFGSTSEMMEKKLKNQAKNDAKRQEKMKKFTEKQEKLQQLKELQGNKKETLKKTSKVDVDTSDVYESKVSKGEKKYLGDPMIPNYNPKFVESDWYAWWEKEGFFKPEYFGVNNPKGVFTIVIPPPNVTGSLHLGHALTNAIEDAITRWNRMKGKAVLWNPGCDHAGIATQVVVEKNLWKSRQQTRYDLGRDKFTEEIWKWKNQYGDRIYSQFRRLGSSLDWDRACFTMDEKLANAVREAFVRLHEEGIIYRSTRLVNWCIQLKTVISNLEVDYRDFKGKTSLSVPGHDENKKYEFGLLTSFAYPIEHSDDEIIVATTRPETMLADTAVAVHPDDTRYKHLVGKFVIHPFSNRRIPIIADAMVVQEFGTGAVKITPAHDPKDYECGKRHNLPFITVFNLEGCINEIGGAEFAGMKRFDARERVVEALKQKGLLRDIQEYEIILPFCSRSGDIIEPMLMPQWFVKSDQLAQGAIDAVRSGDLKLTPQQFEKTWYSWMDNIHDWCISRQLWWGHRVPAYHVDVAGQPRNPDEETYWVSARNQTEAYEKARSRFPEIPEDQIVLTQDEDVLDTWFSSGLFPFSIFGWPEKTKDYQQFYPTSLLETGHDILFFWVARMVMLGLKLTGQLPFKEVFLHAMIRDAHGRKMSKSLGNVIDPIDVIEGITLEKLHQQLLEGNLSSKDVEKAKLGQKEDYPNGIPECGADALRFALCAYTSQARDINLDIKRVVGYRTFCNKIWNATKFVLMKLGDDFVPVSDLTVDDASFSIGDRWILGCLHQCISKCNEGFSNYDLHSVTSAIFNFWLYEFCDVYLELIKPILGVASSDETRLTQRTARNVLYECVENALRLLSPFMPYLTEELWQRLPRRLTEKAPSICVAAYPEDSPVWKTNETQAEFKFLLDIVRGARSLISDYLKSHQKPTTYVICKTHQTLSIVTREQSTICTLAKIESITILFQEVPSGCAIYTISEECLVLLTLKGVISIEDEITKLQKEKVQLESQFANFLNQTKVDDYELKVPEEVRQVTLSKMSTMKTEIDHLEKAVQDFLHIL